jgi:hypothetical protein
MISSIHFTHTLKPEKADGFVESFKMPMSENLPVWLYRNPKEAGELRQVEHWTIDRERVMDVNE